MNTGNSVTEANSDTTLNVGAVILPGTTMALLEALAVTDGVSIEEQIAAFAQVRADALIDQGATRPEHLEAVQAAWDADESANGCLRSVPIPHLPEAVDATLATAHPLILDDELFFKLIAACESAGTTAPDIIMRALDGESVDLGTGHPLTIPATLADAARTCGAYDDLAPMEYIADALHRDFEAQLAETQSIPTKRMLCEAAEAVDNWIAENYPEENSPEEPEGQDQDGKVEIVITDADPHTLDIIRRAAKASGLTMGQFVEQAARLAIIREGMAADARHATGSEGATSGPAQN